MENRGLHQHASVWFSSNQVQNKAVRANKAVIFSLLSTNYFKILIYLISIAHVMCSFDNCGLPEHFDNSFWKIASVHNYQTRLASSLENTIYPEWNHLRVSFLEYLLVQNFGLKLLKAWKSCAFFLFGTHYKNVLWRELTTDRLSSCSLTNTPIDSSFVCLYLFYVSLYMNPLLSVVTSPFLVLSSGHLSVHWHAFHFLCIFIFIDTVLCY